MVYTGLSPEEALRFCEHWLPAWSGNEPARLAAFYTEDAFYRDGATGPLGLTGKTALLAYFTKLLAHNPRWVWRHRRAIPLQNGFLNYWQASIPVRERVVQAEGVCVVQLRDRLIYSNEVFFDRHELLEVIRQSRRSKP